MCVGGGGRSLEWEEVWSRYVCEGRGEDKWGVGVCVCVWTNGQVGGGGGSNGDWGGWRVLGGGAK